MLQAVILALFAALLGAILCFSGWRFFLVLLPVWAFFGGFWLTTEATRMVLGQGLIGTTTGWVFGLVLGAIFAVCAWLFFDIGIAVVAGLVGAWLAAGLMRVVGLDGGFLPFLIALIAGVCVAVLAFVRGWQRYVVIAATAIFGANALILAALLLLGRVAPDGVLGAGNAIAPVLRDSWFWGLAWLAVAVAGLWSQIANEREFEFFKEDLVQSWG
jgi:hypothetical protein